MYLSPKTTMSRRASKLVCRAAQVASPPHLHVHLAPFHSGGKIGVQDPATGSSAKEPNPDGTDWCLGDLLQYLTGCIPPALARVCECPALPRCRRATGSGLGHRRCPTRPSPVSRNRPSHGFAVAGRRCEWSWPPPHHGTGCADATAGEVHGPGVPVANGFRPRSRATRQTGQAGCFYAGSGRDRPQAGPKPP